MKGYNSVLDKITITLSKAMRKNGYIAGGYTDFYLQRLIKMYSHPNNNNLTEDYEKAKTRILKEEAIITEGATDLATRRSLVSGVPTNEYVRRMLPDDTTVHVYVFTLYGIDVESLSGLTEDSNYGDLAEAMDSYLL